MNNQDRKKSRPNADENNTQDRNEGQLVHQSQTRQYTNATALPDEVLLNFAFSLTLERDQCQNS